MENKVTDVEYPKAKLYKRWLAFIIDIFIAFILGMLISVLAGYVTNQIKSYDNIVERRNEIQINSSLYTSDGQLIILVTDSSKDTIESKTNILEQSIEDFYKDLNFFTTDDEYMYYQERKMNAKANDGGNLFIESSLLHGIYVENGYADTEYYSFYHDEIEKYCIAYLSSNVEFAHLSNLIVRISVIEIFVSMSIGVVISFVLVPFIIKRGRRTIGMYLFKISLIDVNALNVKGKKLLARNLLIIFVGYWLSAVTVLIPMIVSVTMMHLSKTGQDFFDYMTNTYVVDTEKMDVYLDYREYQMRKGESKNASVENSDFKLTR